MKRLCEGYQPTGAIEKRLMFSFLMLITSSVAFSQVPQLYQAGQRKKIEQLASELSKKHQSDYEKALKWAVANNRPTFKTHSNGRIVMLQRLNEVGEPIYVATDNNSQSAIATRTNTVYTGNSLSLSLSGGSAAMAGRLAFWDGGRVLNTHQEFTNRVTQIDNPSTTDSHATHVAGTLTAAGVNTLAKGMSFGATLKAYDFSNDESEMTTAAPNILISNHSYGDYSGWVFNSDRTTTTKWEWWGNANISSSEDYKFGFYDTGSRSWDQIAYNAPYYLIVKSAGNKRSETGPATGAYYFLANSTRDSSNVARSRNDSYDCLPTKSNAKNILTVAAVNPITFSPNSPADIKMSTFSSWGPTDDGRIKPDISGIGVNVLSTTSSGNNAYAILSGTSMSSPQVAGSLFLLQELYAQLNDKQFMRAATLKGLAIHTAEEAGDAAGPDYRFGWGLLNIEKAAKVLVNTDKNHTLVERQLAQSSTFTQDVIASGRGSLVATISWTDPESEATTISAVNVNNRNPKLINDLDIRISDGKNEFLPWILNPEQPSAAATRGDNIRDNVEQVLIPDAVPGRTYTITVKHKGTLQRGPQAYALIMSGIGGTAYCASNATNNADSKITKVVFGTINNTTPSGCTTYSDFTNFSTDVEVGQVIPLEVSLGTCGANANKIAKVFVDWNGDGDFADANELVGTSGVINGTDTYRTNITIPTIVPGNSTRMRIVCVESSDANAITNCGTYAKGETQEFRLNFLRASKDISVSALLSPEPSFCSNPSQGNVTIKLQNFGRETQSNIPIKVEILENSSVVATLSGTYTRSLTILSEDQFTLPGTFEAKPGVSYSFRISATLANDQDASNNQLVVSRATSPASAAPTGTAMLCGNTLQLQGNGNGPVFWYDAPTGGNYLAFGNTSIVSRPAGSKVYAALNDFSGTTGAASKTAFSSGGYNQFSPALRITTQIPLTLEKARLYVGNSGRVKFTVIKESDGTPISSVTLDVKATRNPAAAGAQDDDTRDVGAIYSLNLNIPTAGDYQIAVEFEDGATIFRNNNIAQNPYPIVLSGLMSITGTTATTTPNAFYYYLYDLKVKPLGCQATARTAITVASGTASPATITAQGGSPTLCPNSSLVLSTTTGASNYQWQRNGQNISGATTATLSITEAGLYKVTVTESGKCSSTSDSLKITLKTPTLPTLTFKDNLLTSSVLTNNQWLFNGNAITGATGQTYTALQSGSYSVRALVDGCSVVSDKVSIVITAVEEPPVIEATLKAYPNPITDGILRLEFQPVGNPASVTATIYNVLGVPIKTQSLQQQAKIFSADVDISSFSLGTFFVGVSDGKQVYMKKITKM